MSTNFLSLRLSHKLFSTTLTTDSQTVALEQVDCKNKFQTQSFELFKMFTYEFLAVIISHFYHWLQIYTAGMFEFIVYCVLDNKHICVI